MQIRFRAIESYQEVIFVDATYKLTELRLPVVLFMVEDSMGQTEVAAVGLVVKESFETICWLMQQLKAKNKLSNTRLFMSDKDLNLRRAIEFLFPEKQLMLCLFHSLRNFRREIFKFQLKEGLQVVLKELFQSMCYAKNDKEYESLYILFQDSAPEEVFEYFNVNWHPIKEQWVMGLAFGFGKLLNTTNNRVESFNSKLKSVIDLENSQKIVCGFL